PFGIVPQAATTLILYSAAMQDSKQAQSFVFGSTRDAPPPADEPELYVLVLGESARAMNWELYGYPRDDNPRLKHRSNLVVFRDVVTQVSQTRLSVPLILTRGTVENEQRTTRERSIVSAFR